MNKKSLFITAFLLLYTAQAWCEAAYVIDVLYVPLRSGKGTQFRIIENAMISGTRLEKILEEEDDGANLWTYVETPKGNQGWLQSQYLQAEPVAKDQLVTVQQQLATLRNQQQSVSGKASELEALNADLGKELDDATIQVAQLHQQLEDIKKVSANALVLNENNQHLLEEREVLKTRIDVVEAENERLSDDSKQTWFLYGAFAVGIGCLLTLIIQRVRVKRRSSEWA